MTSHEAYLVGGYVRDRLLGRPTRDMDLAVTADVPQVARALAEAWGGSYVLLDEKHQIARVILPDTPEPWYLDFSRMQGDLRQDLSRRDFTIDALAVNLHQKKNGLTRAEVIDPFGGRPDLEAGLVRALSPQVFSEDPGRLLRAVRLAAELGFSLEEETRALIQRDRLYLNQVAGERRREELNRILALPHATPALRTLDELGLLDVLLPELAEGRGVAQPPEHFWDVFAHSLETVAALESLLEEGGRQKEGLLAEVPWSPELAQHFAEEVAKEQRRQALLKLAALLHDIGKPRSKTVEPSGRIRFFGHSRLGAEMALGIMERLRFSHREARLVEKAIYHHLRPSQMALDQLPTPRALYRYFRDTAEVALDVLFLNLADHLATRGPRLPVEPWHEHVHLTSYILDYWFEKQKIVAPPKLVDGHDLMAYLGLPPGPVIGALLEALREAQAAGEITNREQALILAEKLLRAKKVALENGPEPKEGGESWN